MSTAEYKKKNYTQLGFLVKKGQEIEYKARAAELGISLSELIKRSLDEYSGFGHVAPVKSAPIGTMLTAEQRKILDAVESLPESSRKALLKFLQTLVDAKSD